MEPVRIERFYLGCLAHASYMIASDGICAVIDPQRDVELYLETAASRGYKIEHVIETHLHADFVSGHRELADRTGAKIYIGAGSGAEFPHIEARDGDEIHFGQCTLQFLHTPGHTLESICILMKDAGDPKRPASLFTGDTLFIGDVGRPDLSPKHTPQQLAEILYHSIHNKLLTLPDDTEIFPAHGAGSLCGRSMSSESCSTIGKQRRSNYALLARDADEFVHLLTDNLPARPEYFSRDADLNRRGATHVSQLPELSALVAEQVLKVQKEGALVLDTRPAMEFAGAHVPGSVHIALTGQYASWAARLLGLDTPLIIVSEDAEHVRESQLRLARVGVENVIGYLKDGLVGWIKQGYELDYMPQLTVEDFVDIKNQSTQPLAVLDVRELGEVSAGAIEGATCIPLGKLASRVKELETEKDKLLVVHCKGGYRSSIATSILRRAGFRDIANLTGGFDAWKAAGQPCVVADKTAL